MDSLAINIGFLLMQICLLLGMIFLIFKIGYAISKRIAKWVADHPEDKSSESRTVEK